MTASFFLDCGPGLGAMRLSVDDEMLLFDEDRASIELPRGRHILACTVMGAPDSYVTVHCVADGVSRKVFDRLTIPPNSAMTSAHVEIEL